MNLALKEYNCGKPVFIVCCFLEKYVWDADNHGPNVEIVADNPSVLLRKVARQHTDGCRGRLGFNKGRHTFKFIFNDKPWGSHCAIGVCSARSKLSATGMPVFATFVQKRD